MKKVSDFKSIPGKGAQGTVEGKAVKVVSPGYLRENGIEYKNGKIDELNAQGKTIIYVTHSKELASKASRRIIILDGEVGAGLEDEPD